MVIIIVTHSFTMEKKFIHSSINQSIIRIHFNIYADTQLLLCKNHYENVFFFFFLCLTE